MENNHLESPRIAEVRAKLESLIEKNQSEVGSGKSLSTIEGDLLGELLNIGRLLLEDRVVEEEKKLEHLGYEVEGEKNQSEARPV